MSKYIITVKWGRLLYVLVIGAIGVWFVGSWRVIPFIMLASIYNNE